MRSTSNKTSLPATCRKKNILRNETLQTQTSLSRLPPPFFRRGELLGHNSGRHSPKSVPSLRRTQPANSPSLIAQTISREKNQGPIKSFGATLQAFVLYKKRATNVNLCSLDDGIPVHEKINVAALSPLHLSDEFDALEEYFCAFPQASLFVLTLLPLQKYSEKIFWTSFSPNSPYCYATITAETPSLSLNRCVLDAHLVYADVSSLICLRHGCVPKNGHDINHVLAVASTLHSAQSHRPERSSTAPSKPPDVCLNRHASKTKVDRNRIVQHGTTAEKRRRKHYTTVNK